MTTATCINCGGQFPFADALDRMTANALHGLGECVPRPGQTWSMTHHYLAQGYSPEEAHAMAKQHSEPVQEEANIIAEKLEPGSSVKLEED